MYTAIYTIKFLAPIMLSACAEGFMNGHGYVCVPNSRPNVVKYYESDKSCYKNGIFYQQCKDGPGINY